VKIWSERGGAHWPEHGAVIGLAAGRACAERRRGGHHDLRVACRAGARRASSLPAPSNRLGLPAAMARQYSAPCWCTCS